MKKRISKEGGWSEVARTIMRRSNSPHVVVGPMTWQPSDGADSKVWYFMVATSVKSAGMFLQRINVPDESYRIAIMTGLISHRPVVLHDMDDELAMARLCDALWPSERAKRLCANIEAERAAAVASETGGETNETNLPSISI